MAVAAMVFSACGKKDDPKKPADDPGNDPGNKEPEEQEYVKPIDIDGDFADWAKLDASKVIEVKCASDAAKTDLKLMKVYADETYVFCYVEFDFSNYDNAPDACHFHFYFNGDNDTATGGWSAAWDQGDTPCIDMFCEADVIADGEVVDLYNPGSHKYAGAPNTSEWGWDDVSVDGFINGMGSKKAFEFQITRELYPLGKLANPFTMGVDCCTNGWDATGVLPNAEYTEENNGLAPLLVVKY